MMRLPMCVLMSLLTVVLMLGGIAVRPPQVADAHAVPVPCDFITGGGWVIADSGEHANFGAHGGCKNGAFWGNVNFVDHTVRPGFHVHGDSKMVTGYLTPDAGGSPVPPERDICGIGRIVKGGMSGFESGETIRYRVKMRDNGEPGGSDLFGIRVRDVDSSKEYHLSTRELGPAGGPTGGGGNIQLHKPNPSTTGPVPPPDEAAMCGGLASP